MEVPGMALGKRWEDTYGRKIMPAHSYVQIYQAFRVLP
jgi:hypothetical protein